MKIKSILLLLIISLLMNGIYIITITAAEVSPSMQTAYEEIALQRALWGAVPVTGYDIDVWNEYDVLVVDIPGAFPANLASLKEPDGSGNDYNSGVDEYRYIGYNPDGYLVNNPKYPDDHSGSAVINNYNWQKNTDDKTHIAQYISVPEDQAFYETEIFYFLESEYGHRFDNTADPRSWIDNAIVIVPVTTTGDGVIKYLHKWDSNHDGVDEDWYITVNLRAKNKVIVPEGSRVEASNSTSSSSQMQQGENRIAAGPRGKELFDVSLGIPSSENLYINLRADEYLYSQTYRQVSGSVTYKVLVNKAYTLWRWDDRDVMVDLNHDGDYLDTGEIVGGWDSRVEYVSKTYDVVRDYSYYVIDELSVFGLTSATVRNEALPEGKYVLESASNLPTVSMNRSTAPGEHVRYPIEGTSLVVEIDGGDLGLGDHSGSYPTLGEEDLTSAAEGAIANIQVRNDGLVFNADVLMEDGWHEVATTAPKDIPEAPLCDENDLYQANLMIPKSISNGERISSGTLSYTRIVSTSTENTRDVAIIGLNSVRVHTPTVCVPILNQISRKTQKYQTDASKYPLVLGESFHIDYPMTGEHLSILGYGLRDYSKYLGQKQIFFPFDVMVGKGYDGKFVKKNTWISFGPTGADFFIPEWNTEGSGNILFRSLPINLANIDDPNYEYHANRDIMNYKAVESFSYELCGKMEGFQVKGGGDDYWAPYFEKVDLAVNAGDLKKDLPILPGKVAYKDVKSDATGGLLKEEYLDGMMLGYPIRFDLVSNGSLYGDQDLIRVVPRFYYVPIEAGKINMSKRTEVDLYLAGYSTMTKLEKSFWLDQEDRSLIGKESIPSAVSVGISDTTRNAVRQRFSGSFYLENNTYAVPKGTEVLSLKSIDVNQSPFLHNGYIIVNFEIEAYKNVMDRTKLGSQKPTMTYSVGWEQDGYVLSQAGLNLNYGDIVFYSTDRRASQTYQ